MLPKHHIDAFQMAEQKMGDVKNTTVVLRAEGRQKRIAQGQCRHQHLTESETDVLLFPLIFLDRFFQTQTSAFKVKWVHN